MEPFAPFEHADKSENRATMPVAVICTHCEHCSGSDIHDTDHAKLSADPVAEVTKGEHANDGARECQGRQNPAATLGDGVLAVERGEDGEDGADDTIGVAIREEGSPAAGECVSEFNGTRTWRLTQR